MVPRAEIRAGAIVTRERLVADLRAHAQREHRSPTSREFPGAELAIRVFGSWNMALAAAGLPARGQGENVASRCWYLTDQGHAYLAAHRNPRAPARETAEAVA